MCNCGKLAFTGPAPCGCQGHPVAFDGTGINNGDTLTPEQAMQLVEQLLLCADEQDGLTADELAQLKVDRYAKMRYYLQTNELALTEANIRTYQKSTMSPCGSPQLVTKYPVLVTLSAVLVLLAVGIATLYYLTSEA